MATGLALTTEAFFTLPNLLNVLRQASLTFLIASGLTLTILTAGLDLSVGANVGLSACLAATVMKSSGSIALGVATGLAFGAVVGILERADGHRAEAPAVHRDVRHAVDAERGDVLVHGRRDDPRIFSRLSHARQRLLAGHPACPSMSMAAFLAAGGILTRYTTFGHEVYAIGANREAARLSGIPVRARLNLVYTLSGAMAGLAAIVYLARLNSAEADIGEALTLPAIAAVLIGGTSLFGGVGSLTGTLVGALTLTLVVNGMNLRAVDANWQPLVTGAIVLLAVWIDVVTRQRAEARV